MIRRRIFNLAWPAVCEMLLYMLLDFVDVAFVGRLGARPLAAVGLGAQIFFSVIFIFSAMSAGATALIARAIGAGDMRRAGRVAGHALILAFLAGGVVTFVIYRFAGDVAALFRFEPAVQHLAAVYMRITGLSAAFSLVYFIGNGIFRGAGMTRIPLLVAALANVVHIGIEYVLIFGKLGFPALGMRGAAIATACTQVFCCCVVLSLLFSGVTGLRVSLKEVLRSCDFALIKSIVRLSLPAGCEQALMDLGWIIGSFMLAGLGTVPFAAHQVVLTAESLSYMPGYGFAVAATTLVGQNLGARNPDGASANAVTAARMALLVMGGFAFLFLALPGPVVGIFTSDPQVASLGALCLRIAALEQPSIALEMVFAGALRGAGDTRTPAMVTVLSTWLLRIPLLYLSVYVLRFGLPAVWVITALDWSVRAASLTLLFRMGHWKQIECA